MKTEALTLLFVLQQAEGFGTKDLATLGVAAAAFLLSLISTTITLIRGRREKQRAIRNEITNVLSQIVATALENAKLYQESNETPTPYFQAVSSILNQRNAFLLNQAVFLADQVPDLITAVEYNTLAAANANAGDLFTAGKFYRKAIEASKEAFYKGMAMRSYAGFLFTQRDLEAGRQNFANAIRLFAGENNQARYTRGYTYQMWSWNELFNAESVEMARQRFANAEAEFHSIDNDKLEHDSIAGLYAAVQLPPLTGRAVSIQG